jgi:sugar phosphate isomerase/epimerase
MMESARLSVQLYSLRSVPDPAARLRLVAASGLKHVETSSSDHADVRMMCRLLDEHGLSAPSGHYGIEAFRDRLAWVVETAGILGQERVVLWGFPETEHWPDPLGWARAGEELGRIAERLRDAGITFAFHNHDWELRRFSCGRMALDILFHAAAGSPLRFQPDLAWIVRGGEDPSAILVRHADKIIACHVKDLAAPGENVDEDGWADLGEGRIAWNDLWPAARAAGARLMVLEHDAPSDPARFLAVSVAAARALALRSQEPLG